MGICLGDPYGTGTDGQTGRAVQAPRQWLGGQFAAAQAQRAQAAIAGIGDPQQRRIRTQCDRLRELQAGLRARAIAFTEAPGALPDQGLHQIAAQLQRTDRRAQCVGHVQHLLDHGHGGGLGERGQVATAVALVDGAAAGAPLQAALAEVIAPDAVVAGHGDVQLVFGDGQANRMIQRHLPRLRHRPFLGSTRTTVAAQGVDQAGQQVDAAHGVVAGVGHVQRLTLQRQRQRPMEGGFGEIAVHEVGGAQAELTQHAAAMTAFQDAVVAAVGDVQPFLVHGETHGESQRLARLGVQFAAAARRGRRRTLAKGIQGPLQLTGHALADQPLLFAALRVQQHHGRPSGDAEAAPAIPIGIEQHRHGQALPAQQFQRSSGITLEIEARYLQHQRLQLARVA
ncbi:hypothetical protein D3C73_864740 [compost metagenome]